MVLMPPAKGIRIWLDLKAVSKGLPGWNNVFITKTCLYNFDPLKPHFYIVKLGFTGVYIIFLISAQNIDCEYSLKLPHRGSSNVYPQYMFWAEIWKISGFFIWKFSIFLVVKFSVCLKRHVFVMVLFSICDFTDKSKVLWSCWGKQLTYPHIFWEGLVFKVVKQYFGNTLRK